MSARLVSIGQKKHGSWNRQGQCHRSPCFGCSATSAACRWHRKPFACSTAISCQPQTQTPPCMRSRDRTVSDHSTATLRPRDSDGTFLVVLRQAFPFHASPIVLTSLVVERHLRTILEWSPVPEGLEKLKRFLQRLLRGLGCPTQLNAGGDQTRVHLGPTVRGDEVTAVLQGLTVARRDGSRPR